MSNNAPCCDKEESQKKKSTVAFKEKKQKCSYKYIDMELKKQRNKEAKPLRDEE